MAEKTVRYRVRFVGHVQGVGFRMTAIDQATDLDLHGFVRNEADGSVLADVEGSVTALKQWIRRMQSVMCDNLQDTQIDVVTPSGISSGFHIRY
jgi:acylphosphatase